MRTVYSIISVATQVSFGEQLGIGLLCISGNTVRFHYSEEKLHIIGKLLSPSAKKMALTALQSLQKAVESSAEQELFPTTPNLIVSEEYVSYLSRYANNLVQFSVPVNVSVLLDEGVFQQLFRKFIFSGELFHAALKPERSIQLFRQQLYTEVSGYTNTHFKVTQTYLPNLIVPVTVDLFGKNAVYVAGQAIDFGQSLQALENSISKYMNVVLSSAMEERYATCYIIGDEPENTTRQHEIWQQVRTNGRLDYVPTNETERIVSYLREHDVKPVED